MLLARLFHGNQGFHESADRSVIGGIQVVPYIDNPLQLRVYRLVTLAGLKPLGSGAQLLCQSPQSIYTGARFSAFAYVPDIGVSETGPAASLGLTDFQRLKALLDTLC
jgi:hypothetical protein